MNILKNALKIDFFAGAGSVAWALAAQNVEQMHNIVSWEAAAAFGLAAFGRWYLNLRSAEAPSTKEG